MSPHLIFCSTFLYGLPDYKLCKFQVVQNKALKTILKSNRNSPVNVMQETLYILSVEQKIMFNAYVFVYKLKNKLLPDYICENIFSDVHNYNTRNRKNFIISRKCESNLAFQLITV